jgi:hypothetical protein
MRRWREIGIRCTTAGRILVGEFRLFASIYVARLIIWRELRRRARLEAAGVTGNTSKAN